MEPLTMIAAFNGAIAAAETIQKLIEHSRQSGEMTLAEEQAWQEAKAKAYTEPHWQPSQP